MIISYKYKYICLNPPKTGSGYRESVFHNFSDINIQLHRHTKYQNLLLEWENNNKIGPKPDLSIVDMPEYRHYNLSEALPWLRDKGIDSRDFYWFTFTRNPWDRAVSFYNMNINQRLYNLNPGHVIPINVDGNNQPILTSDDFLLFIKRHMHDNLRQIRYIRHNKYYVDEYTDIKNMHNSLSKITKQLKIDNVNLDRNKNTHRLYTRYDKEIRELWTDEIIDYIADYDRGVINHLNYTFKK